jgi:putative ATPase
MRPRNFDEFVGQQHIVGEGKMLRRMIETDKLTSIVLWGPPGSGKTTLASIIAEHTQSAFHTLSAVLAGIKELREVLDEAKERRVMYGRRTVLFVDEIHRWNKAQQDALLPHVEDGSIILIGATTENPAFEIIRPLLSRSRVFRLEALTADDLRTVITKALTEKEKGFGMRKVKVEDDAIDHIIRISDGDARNALNALELAVLSTPAQKRDNTIHVDLAVAQESIQRRAVAYDKGGDEHYDTISAFIKSVRGSDPDATLYWLAKMIHAGEDPRFIMRRLLILAGEDIGLADPNGIVVAASCATAFEWVGLPEGLYHLGLAALYLATTAKSNTVSSVFGAIKDVEEGAPTSVPIHLSSNPMNRTIDHPTYKYPHAFPGHWVEQDYLPDGLKGKQWYTPSDQGYEARIAEWLAQLKGS